MVLQNKTPTRNFVYLVGVLLCKNEIDSGFLALAFLRL